MQLGIDADGRERAQVLLLQIRRRWLDDDLVLIIVLQAVGIFAVAAVFRPARGLHVGRGPGLGPTERSVVAGWKVPAPISMS